MSDSLNGAYGGKGPLLLGITWTEMGLALILLVLRARTASVCPSGKLSSGIFGLRWDFIWVVVAFVRGPTHPRRMLTMIDFCDLRAELHDRERSIRAGKPSRSSSYREYCQDKLMELDGPDRGNSLLGYLAGCRDRFPPLPAVGDHEQE